MDENAVAKALTEARALVACLEDIQQRGEKSVEASKHLVLLEHVDKCRAALEEPYDIGTRWLENMSEASALFLLLRIGAFERVPTERSIAATSLASACNVDVSVITRAMRILVARGIFTETNDDEYKHSSTSRAFSPEGLGGFVCVSIGIMKSWIAMPDYVKAHKPDELFDPRKSPFAFAEGHEGKTYYEVLDLDPRERQLWNRTLQNMSKNFPVLGMFPFREMGDKVRAEPERPFIVDIGGGRGQALLQIRTECDGDGFGGRLVLQDLPPVIESLQPDDVPGVETMSHDIFTQQPIKNAHIYYMRRLLHDFYDPKVIDILRNTASAMGPSSRLVICDMLVPDRVQVGGPMTLYWLDFALMAIGGKERSLNDFRRVLSEAGLELVKVYNAPGSNVANLETCLLR